MRIMSKNMNYMTKEKATRFIENEINGKVHFFTFCTREEKEKIVALAHFFDLWNMIPCLWKEEFEYWQE